MNGNTLARYIMGNSRTKSKETQALHQRPTVNYQRLSKQLLSDVGVKEMANKAVSATPQTTWGHGNGGLFSSPALETPIFSAMLLPRTGVHATLPTFPSRNQNPLFGIFTGVTATTGSEPTGVCDDPPTSGLSKLCNHTFLFGRMARQTPVIDLTRVGLTANRGEHLDLQFMGNPFQSGTQGQVPSIPFAQGGSPMLNQEVAKTFFEFAIAWSRDFATDFYAGNPTNNTASGGRKYYYGMDILINTGYRDAETGQACAAADSIVESFGSVEVNSTNAATLVRHVTSIYRRLKYIAENAGLAPVKWVIAMKHHAFYEISEFWPIAYHTFRNTVTVNNQTMFNLGENITKMRDEMRGNIEARTGQYLLIDGEKVEVVLDDGIAETNLAGGSFSSALYFIPMTVLGSTPVTYFEHINYDMPDGAMAAAALFAPDGSYMTSDAGRFLLHKKPPTNFCVQLVGVTEPRLLLLTPHLAARLTAVKYTPFAHTRGWSPSDSSFYVNGGRSNYIGFGPSYYSPTA